IKTRYLAVLGVCLFMYSCESPSSESVPVVKHANVIMLEGPLFEDGYSLFEYKGRLQNIGEATAKFTKVYVYVRKSDSTLIAQEDTYADDTDLVPQETTAWNVLLWDEDHAIRNSMEKHKLTYETKGGEKWGHSTP